MSDYRMEPLGDLPIIIPRSTIKKQYYFPTPKEEEEPKKVQQYYFPTPKEYKGLPMAYYHRYMPLELTQEEVNYLEYGEIKRTSWLKRYTDQRQELKWS